MLGHRYLMEQMNNYLSSLINMHSWFGILSAVTYYIVSGLHFCRSQKITGSNIKFSTSVYIYAHASRPYILILTFSPFVLFFGVSSMRSETTVLPNQQPKKRRRKDLTKSNGENDDGRLPNKHTKLGKTTAAKNTFTLAKNLPTSAQSVAVSGEHGEDLRFQNQLNSSAFFSKKKSSESKTILDPSFLKVSNGDTSVALAEAKDIDKQKASKDSSSKFKDVAVSSDALHQKYHDKSAYAQSRPQSGKLLGGSVDELESTVRSKEKNGIREQPDISAFEGKYSTPSTVSISYSQFLCYFACTNF